MTYQEIEAGDTVTVEETLGWGTGSPVRTVHTGVASVDDEGVLRVDGVNLTRDERGYFRTGVLPISVTKR